MQWYILNNYCLFVKKKFVPLGEEVVAEWESFIDLEERRRNGAEITIGNMGIFGEEVERREKRIIEKKKNLEKSGRWGWRRKTKDEWQCCLKRK